MALVSLRWANTRLVRTVRRLADVPADPRPQVAVAGASNVGKSSLLGALFGRRGLVRASKTPGCTRALLFYEVDARLWLVDLPGYGYARVSQTERERWRGLIEGYLRQGRPALVLVLMDARHAPKPADVQLITWLNAEGLRWAPVLTKADRLRQAERAQAQRALQEALGLAPLFTSSRSGEGIARLRALILREAGLAGEEA